MKSGDVQARGSKIEAIQLAVAGAFSLSVDELGKPDMRRTVLIPRQIAMYLAKQMTEASLPEIGRQFGNKHHTTVMHSINKIEALRRQDKDLHRMISKMIDSFG